MRVRAIRSRGILFSFEELDTTNVYVIEGTHQRFICDTFLGPDPMREVCDYLVSRFGHKRLAVLNSHSDWDHIWGNCVFDASLIHGHQNIVEAIDASGTSDLKKHDKWKRGDVSIVLPGVLFGSTLEFRHEGVRFFYSPGHTKDSSSCIDTLDNVLYAGDNVEEPLPYLSSLDIDSYIQSLVHYTELAPEVVVPGHGDVAGLGLVTRNLEYLRLVREGLPFTVSDGAALARHKANLEYVARAKDV